MPHRFYEVDITFAQRSGATIPVTAKAEKEAREIAIELFSDYEDLEIAAVRPMPTPEELKAQPQQAEPASLLVN